MTNRKFTEQNTVEHLEKIISLLPGHVYWKDRNGVLLGCNDEQAKDIGLKSRHDAIGLTAYDTLPKDLADAITKIDEEVMSTGISKTIEEVLTLPDGKKMIWLSKKVPLHNEENKVVGLLGVSLDITDFKHTQRKLRKTKHKLNAISFSLAHELRTPLATLELMRSGLDHFFPLLLKNYAIAKEVNAPILEIPAIKLKLMESSLEKMKLQIKSASNLIDMLLVKIKPSVSAKSNEFFSIVSCIEGAVDHYPFLGNQRELIDFESSNDFLVQGDNLLVTHIFFNLIKNALHYVEAVGKGGISIWLEKGLDFNKVFFKDTGKGISPDVLPKIFKKFFSKTRHGTGIGLAFCKTVMESVEGEIACESIEGEYSMFILSFPVLSKINDKK